MTTRTTPFCTPAAAALALALLVLPGCTSGGGSDNTVANQAQQVSGRDYISGDGRIEAITAEQRGKPVELMGKTLDGTAWSSADHRGDVVVLNVWGSWCPPCVAEMPELQKAWSAMQADKLPVTFMGINLEDSPATAQAFLKRANATYPSLADDGGASLIALQEKASSPPTTLVLDKQGRIAARIAGEATASTLRGLVDDVLAEG